MRFSIIATLAILSSSAFARNCHEGTYYCGHTLTNIGNYEAQLAQNLYDRGIDYTNHHFSNMLFYCYGGAYGLIDLHENCLTEGRYCVDSGDSSSDWCA